MAFKAHGILAAPGRLALALLVFASASAFAAADKLLLKEQKEQHELITFGIKRWFSIGRDTVRVSQPIPPALVNPAGVQARIGNTYEFNRADASLSLYSMEVRPLKRLAFDVQYAGGQMRDGNTVEHDWIDSTGNILVSAASGHVFDHPHFEDVGRAEIAQSGRTEWLTTSAYFLLLATRSDPFTEWDYFQRLEILAGYNRYSEDFHLRQWNQAFSTTYLLSEAPLGYLAGYDSSYHLVWEGGRAGFRDSLLTTFGLKFSAVLAYSPLQHYGAEGFDNIQAAAGKLRGASPNYKQRADGSIFDGSFEASYSPVKAFSIEAGWSFLYLWARNGSETDFLPNGTGGEKTLDSAVSQRMGWHAGASLHF
ncbi:MAG: hypothetical protein HY077_09410 [Elusimicrobia bacterium]|nr:hypothetical protein [Elusimicrobiota bacterium]